MTLILVTPGQNPETLQQDYSKDIPSYFLKIGKCFVFVFCSLSYLISFYSVISKQEALGKEKKSY